MPHVVGISDKKKKFSTDSRMKCMQSQQDIFTLNFCNQNGKISRLKISEEKWKILLLFKNRMKLCAKIHVKMSPLT